MSDSDRPRDEDGRTLSELKEAGIVDGGRDECRYCGSEGDCRPVALRNRTGVPALCEPCYNWIRDRGLFDEAKDTQLFFPPEMGGKKRIALPDGGRPEHEDGQQLSNEEARRLSQTIRHPNEIPRVVVRNSVLMLLPSIGLALLGFGTSLSLPNYMTVAPLIVALSLLSVGIYRFDTSQPSFEVDHGS